MAHSRGNLRRLSRLPLHLRTRSEFEYVGAKPLGDNFTGVPNTEVRGALLRTVKQGRMDLGVNFLIARGYTGQTTEILAATGPPHSNAPSASASRPTSASPVPTASNPASPTDHERIPSKASVRPASVIYGATRSGFSVRAQGL
jgi:hypothetical protein